MAEDGRRLGLARRLGRVLARALSQMTWMRSPSSQSVTRWLATSAPTLSGCPAGSAIPLPSTARSISITVPPGRAPAWAGPAGLALRIRSVARSSTSRLDGTVLTGWPPMSTWTVNSSAHTYASCPARAAPILIRCTAGIALYWHAPDGTVAALQVCALALSGFAQPPATGPGPKAGKEFARAHAVTNAAGVAADTRHLLSAIVSYDRSESSPSPRRARPVMAATGGCRRLRPATR